MTVLAKARALRSPVVLVMAGLALLAIVVRAFFFRQAAYTSIDPVMLDAWVWQAWARFLAEHGLDDLSQISPKTYLGYHYVFWATGKVYRLIDPHFLDPDFVPSMRLHFALKVPPVLFDLALMPLIFMATRRVARLLPAGLATARRLAPVQALERRGLAAADQLGLLAAAAFVFSPGVIYDSAVWIQFEGTISFFMLAAVLLLASGRVGWAWALWGIAFVIKPQPVVIVPALAAFTFWRFGWRGVLRGAAGAAAGVFSLLGYFIATGNGPYIIDVYRELFQTFDAHISINAWNLWWIGHLHGLRASDVVLPLGPVDLTVEGTSFVVLVLATVAVLAYLHVRRDLVGLLVSCAMLKFAFFLFPISTHERYLYPFFVFLAPVMLLQRRWLILYVPMTAIFFLNIFFASPSDPDIFATYLESGFGQAMAVVNVAFFVVAIGALLSTALRVRPWPNPLRPAPAAAG